MGDSVVYCSVERLFLYGRSVLSWCPDISMVGTDWPRLVSPRAVAFWFTRPLQSLARDSWQANIHSKKKKLTINGPLPTPLPLL